MNRKCKNSPDRFCYVCGKVTFSDQQCTITPLVKSLYNAYFGIKLGDQDKGFAPHICCKACVIALRRWSEGKTNCLSFGVPMVWREGKDHITDCYFCMANLKGVNKKNKHTVVYPDVPSAIKPQPHSPEVPVPSPPANTELQDNIEDIEVDDTDTSVTYQPTSTISSPRPLTQGQLNDLTRDLGLSKENAQLLASRLSESNLLSQETTLLVYK